MLADDPEISCLVEEYPVDSFRTLALTHRVDEVSIKKKQQFTAFAMIAELAAGAAEPSVDLQGQFDLLDVQIQTFPEKEYGYHVSTMAVIEDLTNNAAKPGNGDF